MAITAHGNELEDFDTVVGTWTHHTTGQASAVFRTGYGRCAMAQTVANPASYLMKYFRNSARAIQDKTTHAITARIGACGLASTYNGSAQVFFCFSHAGTPVLGVGKAATSNYLLLCKWTGAAWSTLATNTTGTVNAAKRFDIYLEHYGAGDATERCRVWMQEIAGSAPAQLWLDYSGDLTTPGVAHVDGVWVSGPNPGQISTGTDGPIGEVIAADEPTCRMGLVTKYLSGAGRANTWTSGTYASIDELNADTSDNLESATGAQVFAGALTGWPASGNFTPLSVQVTALPALGSSGPTQIALGVGDGSTEAYGSDQAVEVAYIPKWHIMSGTNPVTTNPWAEADMAGLELAIKSVT